MNHLRHGSWLSNLCDQSRGLVLSTTILDDFPDLAKQQNLVKNHDLQSIKSKCKHKAFQAPLRRHGRGQSRWNWRLTNRGQACQNSAESAVHA